MYMYMYMYIYIYTYIYIFIISRFVITSSRPLCITYVPVEEGRGRGRAVLESLGGRVHGEHHVQVVHHLSIEQHSFRYQEHSWQFFIS